MVGLKVSDDAYTYGVRVVANSGADKRGGYIVDCQWAKAKEWATDPEEAKRCWKWSEEIVGETFDF